MNLLKQLFFIMLYESSNSFNNVQFSFMPACRMVCEWMARQKTFVNFQSSTHFQHSVPWRWLFKNKKTLARNAIPKALLFAFRCILWPNTNPRFYLPGHIIYSVTCIPLIPWCYRIGETCTLIKSSLTLFDWSELQNILYTLPKTEANFFHL